MALQNDTETTKRLAFMLVWLLTSPYDCNALCTGSLVDTRVIIFKSSIVQLKVNIIRLVSQVQKMFLANTILFKKQITFKWENFGAKIFWCEVLSHIFAIWQSRLGMLYTFIPNIFWIWRNWRFLVYILSIKKCSLYYTGVRQYSLLEVEKFRNSSFCGTIVAHCFLTCWRTYGFIVNGGEFPKVWPIPSSYLIVFVESRVCF